MVMNRSVKTCLKIDLTFLKAYLFKFKFIFFNGKWISLPKNAKTVPLAVLVRICWVLWQKQTIPNSQCHYTLEIHFMTDPSPSPSRSPSPVPKSSVDPELWAMSTWHLPNQYVTLRSLTGELSTGYLMLSHISVNHALGSHCIKEREAVKFTLTM